MKTSELTGAALDWAVAKCEDFSDGYAIIRVLDSRVTKIIPGDHETSDVWTSYSPSNDWAQGGPIIEREKIRLDTTWNQEDGNWSARMDTVGGWWPGDTPLIAAMRCHVASELGAEVDVPDELCQA